MIAEARAETQRVTRIATTRGLPGEVIDPVGNKLDEACLFRSRHNDEKHHKKDEGRPLDLVLQDIDNVNMSDHHEDCSPCHGCDAGFHVQGPMTDDYYLAVNSSSW